MKFKADEVLEKIEAKLGQTQKLSKRTILDTVKNTMAFIGDESDMEIDDFFKKVMPIVESMNGNLNKEQANFVKDWTDKNPSNPKDKDKKDKDKDNDDDMPKWYKQELERRKQKEEELEAKLSAFESRKRADDLRTSALSKFKKDFKSDLERNPKIASRMEKRYEKMLSTITAEDDESTLIARITEEFNDAKELAGDGYIPSDGNGGGESSKRKGGLEDPAVAAALKSKGIKVPAPAKSDTPADPSK